MIAETRVVDITPLGAADGSGGYRLTVERSTAWLFKQRRTITAKHVVLSASALVTWRKAVVVLPRDACQACTEPAAGMGSVSTTAGVSGWTVGRAVAVRRKGVVGAIATLLAIYVLVLWLGRYRLCTAGVASCVVPRCHPNRIGGEPLRRSPVYADS